VNPRALIRAIAERRALAARRRRARGELASAQDTLRTMELRARQAARESEASQEAVRGQFMAAIQNFEDCVANAHEWGAL
jgi:hypothetical protein